ncbi:hypothetical protein MBCUT_06890 [Methanobrevibacter cuticularis]|uniref:Uncharacterized protein n=1 Tax=Methanobrevibacter cuticularis TaxID=47311 RepID=A0A166EH64_9EURY|nr:hypothetical protein [Methanobrevibacter cuticularis]KZX16651.1 hypothetical protein MBCUT_06890 [Methanobrevibacter cuticularis]
MLEELLIKIKAVLEGGGFDDAVSSIKSVGIQSQTATEQMKNDINSVKSNSSGVWSSITSNASSAWSSISNGASSIKESISSAFAGAKQSASDFMSHLQGMEGMMAGILGGVGVASVTDLVVGTSAKAEVNKVLLNNMTQTKQGAEALYTAVDNATNKTLVSMQQVIPALNKFKASTGANEQALKGITPKLANFGSYVYAMTGSAALADTAMMDLSKGIDGAFASLDQYGITEKSLMDTGLWSGKKDDVEGYMNAVSQVVGSTDELMGTFTGIKATMGKVFSVAGKQIGQDLLPVLKDLMNGFIDLNKATGGNLTRGILAVVGGLGGLLTVGFGVSTLLPLITSGFGVLKGVLTGIKALATGTALTNAVKGVTESTGLVAHTAELTANTTALTANTAALEANNIARVTSMGAVAAGVKGIGAVGSAAGSAAPGAAAGATGFAAISSSITSMLIPLLAISAVIAIMIPIVAGLVIEIIAFVRLIGEVIKLLGFDKLNLKPAIEGIKQIGLAMWEIGRAFAAMTLINLIGIIHTVTGGILGFFVSLSTFVAEVKAGVPIINELASIADINPNVAKKIKAFDDACQQVVTAVQALSTIDSSLFNWNPFTNFINSLTTAKEDITEAANIINNFKDIHNINPAVVNKLKAVTDSLKHVADSISALRTVDDKLQTWNPLSNLIEAMKSARKDIGNASIQLRSYSTIANVPEGTANKIKTVTDSLKNVAEAISSMRTVDDKLQTWNPLSNLITTMQSARTDIGQASVILAGYSTLANIPEGTAEKIQRVQWSISHVVNALNSLNTLNSKLGEVDLSNLISKMQTARTNIGFASVSLASYSTLANIDSIIYAKIDAVKNAAVRVAQATTSLNGIPAPSGNNNLDLAVETIKKATTKLNELTGLTVNGETVSGVVNAISNAISQINAKLNSANPAPAAKNLGTKIVNGFKSSAIQLKTVAGAEANWAINAINTKASSIWTAGSKLGSSLVRGFRSGLNQSSPGDAAKAAAAEAEFINNAFTDNYSSLYNIGKEAMSSVASGFGSGVNSGSPGDLANAVLAEMNYALDFMSNLIPEAYTLAKTLGETIVSGFGTPTLPSVANEGFEDFKYPAVIGDVPSGGNVTVNNNEWNLTINNPVVKDEDDIDDFEYKLERLLDKKLRTT